ncbi:MAG: 50S ribosomal protein L32 [Coriobacteriia bacterium]|nr:50S ribosomal protein L32 [Coriobacteriia bacterium]
MAVPKRKKGRAKTNSRRSANSRLTVAPRSLCPQCGEAKLPHYVCPNCGTYKGREVIITE